MLHWASIFYFLDFYLPLFPSLSCFVSFLVGGSLVWFMFIFLCVFVCVKHHEVLSSLPGLPFLSDSMLFHQLFSHLHTYWPRLWLQFVFCSFSSSLHCQTFYFMALFCDFLSTYLSVRHFFSPISHLLKAEHLFF